MKKYLKYNWENSVGLYIFLVILTLFGVKYYFHDGDSTSAWFAWGASIFLIILNAVLDYIQWKKLPG
jgi:hypothetical protein